MSVLSKIILSSSIVVICNAIQLTGLSPRSERRERFLAAQKAAEQAEYLKMREHWTKTMTKNIQDSQVGDEKPSEDCALYIGGEGLEQIAQRGERKTFIHQAQDPKDDSSHPQDHDDWRVFSELYAKSEICKKFHVYLNISPQSWKLGTHPDSSWADYFHEKIFFKDEMPALLENLNVEELILHPVIGYTQWHDHVPKQFEDINNASRELEPTKIDLKQYRTQNKMSENNTPMLYKNITPEPIIIEPTLDGLEKQGVYNPTELRSIVDNTICRLAEEYLNDSEEDRQRFAKVTEDEHFNDGKAKRIERYPNELEELGKLRNMKQNMIESFQVSAIQILSDAELCGPI